MRQARLIFAGGGFDQERSIIPILVQFVSRWKWLIADRNTRFSWGELICMGTRYQTISSSTSIGNRFRGVTEQTVARVNGNAVSLILYHIL